MHLINFQVDGLQGIGVKDGDRFRGLT
ncbi:MAG: hypothetical protein QOF32_563, partial [Gammaproteobacteria bacterium]|nr:hypothetical protein [Gammaproteobacteria bacterium]